MLYSPMARNADMVMRIGILAWTPPVTPDVVSCGMAEVGRCVVVDFVGNEVNEGEVKSAFVKMVN
jgi:hypothetical protein